MIRIKENKKLSELTHAAPLARAKTLRGGIKKLEKQGFKVLDATILGQFVPNSYQWARTMKAPGFKYYPRNKTTIYREDMTLQTRSCGSGTHFRISMEVKPGQKAPIGRCYRREKEDGYDIISVSY